MNETNVVRPIVWKRPLKGWLRWMAWALLILVLTGLTWLVIGLASHDEFYNAATASRWLLSLGIALAVSLLLGLLARCLCSWRNFKRLLLGIACLVGLVALFYAQENVRGKVAWGRFKSHWEAKGEKFSFADITPPSVPDDQNFAMAPLVATTYSRFLDRDGRKKSPPDTNVVDQLEMPLDVDNGSPGHAIGNWQKAIPSNLQPWQRYYRRLALTTNLFPVADHPQAPAVDVLLALSKYDSTIEELRKAAARPGSRFPLYFESEQPYTVLLPHLAPLKGCAIVLRLRALAELEAGQSEAALADIRLALNLTEKIRSEPFLISHLVRIAMFQIIEQAIWEGLANQRWTEEQLSELEQQLSPFDFVADYQAAMRGENACQATTIDYLRRRPDQLATVGETGQHGSGSLASLGQYLVPSGFFYQNEIRSSKFILEQFLPVADAGHRTFSPSLVNEANQSLNAMSRTPYTLLCKMLLPGLTRSSHRFAFAQAALVLARCGCALERHRLATRNYPETLDALAPRFLAKVPTDPIGGQPLHYRLTDPEHFILYSVGWNEVDDQGRVDFSKNGFVDLDRGDWVWRYPDSL